MSDICLTCGWDGSHLIPIRWSQKVADSHLVIGERYLVEIVEARSGASERHYFACIRDLWMNLPEGQDQRWPSPESLRKHALIATGFRTINQYVCQTKAEATRQAAALEREAAEYAVVSIDGNIVTVAHPMSQSRKAMGKDAFYASKEAVIAYLADVVGVTVESLAPPREEPPPREEDR